MNQTITDLKERRSIRKYQDRQVDQSLLDQVFEAATYAPTGMNRQSPLIVVVKNEETKNKLRAINAKIMNTTKDPFYNAPVLVVVFGNKNIPTYLYDASLVLGNLMNAAHALGLGSCWIHRAKETFETLEGKEILKEWNISSDYVGVGNCIIGYPDESPIASKRKDGYILYK